MKAAAEVIKANHALPYAVYVSDPVTGVPGYNGDV